MATGLMPCASKKRRMVSALLLVLLPATLEINEAQEAGTDVYQHTVRGFVPGSSAELESNLLEIRRHKHVVRAYDAEGRIRQLGNLKNRARFTFNYSTGALPTSRKGYSYTFTWKSNRPAPFVEVGSGSGS